MALRLKPAQRFYEIVKDIDAEGDNPQPSIMFGYDTDETEYTAQFDWKSIQVKKYRARNSSTETIRSFKVFSDSYAIVPKIQDVFKELAKFDGNFNWTQLVAVLERQGFKRRTF